MRRVGHRPASETRCRFAADAAVAPPAATRNRTIATCCDAVARQTQAQPPPSPLRPPQTKCPNTHSDRGTATARPPAGSFPAGFRTPAPVPVAASVTAGVVQAQRNDAPSSWPPAGPADPLPVRRRRSWRAARGHSRPHHRDPLRRRRSPNTRQAAAIATSPAADQAAQIPIAVAAPPPRRPPAGSFPAGFRTPATGARGSVREGRHPEPCR